METGQGPLPLIAGGAARVVKTVSMWNFSKIVRCFDIKNSLIDRIRVVSLCDFMYVTSTQMKIIKKIICSTKADRNDCLPTETHNIASVYVSVFMRTFVSA